MLQFIHYQYFLRQIRIEILICLLAILSLTLKQIEFMKSPVPRVFKFYSFILQLHCIVAHLEKITVNLEVGTAFVREYFLQIFSF